MRFRRLAIWLSAMALVAAGFGAASSPALAQCAMCYTTAAAQGAKGIQALNLGILVLLIPPLAIFGGILLFAFRHRNSCPSWKERESINSFLARPAAESGGALSAVESVSVLRA